jgi:cbb3-type cytochrome oxidase maturation protein
MSVLVVLIGFSLIVAIGFLLAFLWAVRSGQYDDDVSPSVRILYDNDKPNTDQTNENQTNV